MKEGWELAEVSKLPEEEAMNEQSREKQRRLKGEMAEGESLRRREERVMKKMERMVPGRRVYC